MLYFDNASTTKISKPALEEYISASELFYNPSALYKNAADAKQLLEDARKFFMQKFNAPEKSTFIFTGSATEANNAVINAHVLRMDKKYVFSAGEHSSIYETAKALKERGYNIVFVPLNSSGCVDQDKLYAEIDRSTALVSIIHVSNETGAINDIKEITERVKKINPNTIVHADGVQAVGKFTINLSALGVDYYTISAHKINGPKGIAALYVKTPNKFKPFVLGGGQEMGMRSGTENLPAIAAFKKAVELLKIHDYSQYKQAILSGINQDCVIVSNNNCVDNIISICFKNVRGETILHMLEEKGFLVGTGSACNSKAGFNRVLQNIVGKEYIEGAIRISFGDDVTIEDCKNLGQALNNAVAEYISRIKKI